MSRRVGAAGRSRTVVSLLVLFASVAGLFALGAFAVSRQGDAALLSQTAGLVGSGVERYVSDVELVSNGQRADPQSTLDELRDLAPKLTSGGSVPSPQGGGEVDLQVSSTSSALRAKLRQQARLIDTVEQRGARVLALPANGHRHDVALRSFRVAAAQLVSVTGDIQGQITDDNRGSLRRIAIVEALLGLLSALAAVIVGRSFMSAGRRIEESRYRALANHSTDLVVVVEPTTGLIRYVSPSCRTILGRDPAELNGSVLVDLVHPDDVELAGAVLAELEADANASAVCEYRLRHADGRWCIVETGWSNLVADPSIGGLVGNGRDVSDRRALEDELRHKAFRDDLTGLPNRALFGDRVGQAVERARRSGGAVTVMFIDLDDFKTVNDSLGHNAGDRLLMAVAARIQGCVRSADTAARLGGDEFGILLDDRSTVDVAESLAERMIGVLHDPLELDGVPIVVSASVGVASQHAADLTAEDLLRDADVAMYVAKSRGKGRVEVFAPKMHLAVVERQSLGTDLQLALRNGELEVHYQPLVDLDTERVVGVEALLRWNHPERGLIPPDTFIPIAEEVGAIGEIGAWVVEQACEQLRDWSTRFDAVRDMSMTVNVSAHQLDGGTLYDDVRRAITRTGIVPDRLVLEITEGAVIGDVDVTIQRLKHLRTLGIRLAIDDFGTGYSSLSQLRQLPVDMLKIDKSFVDDAADEGEGRALLHSIIELGRVLNLDILAEGIEHVEQADELRRSSAQLGQGYFYARPAKPADLEETMARGTTSVLQPGR